MSKLFYVIALCLSLSFAGTANATNYGHFGNYANLKQKVILLQNAYKAYNVQRVRIREVVEADKEYVVDPAPQKYVIQHELVPIYQRQIQYVAPIQKVIVQDYYNGYNQKLNFNYGYGGVQSYNSCH